uniref:Uncharacterized protein n=1 Tax=Anguilla anguilla TaxID=7936 RepID=A0A0E9V0Z5_ANGAN
MWKPCTFSPKWSISAKKFSLKNFSSAKSSIQEPESI